MQSVASIDSVYCSATEQISHCGLLESGDAFPLSEGEKRKQQQQKEGGRGLSAYCVYVCVYCVRMHLCMCVLQTCCVKLKLPRGGFGLACS